MSDDAKDTLREIVGLALLCGGVAAIYPPAGAVVAGVVILALRLVPLFAGKKTR
jgi:hypothetical protein